MNPAEFESCDEKQLPVHLNQELMQEIKEDYAKMEADDAFADMAFAIRRLTERHLISEEERAWMESKLFDGRIKEDMVKEKRHEVA